MNFGLFDGPVLILDKTRLNDIYKFKRGDRVRNFERGEGTVFDMCVGLSAEENVYQVEFEAGIDWAFECDLELIKEDN